MATSVLRTLSLAALALLAACTPYNPDLGDAPFKCGPPEQDPRCPDGYSCQADPNGGPDMFCLSPNGTLPPDAKVGNCADDSALEPNDTTATAFQTPVATQKNDLSFAGLAICPQGDKDTYAVTITMAQQNLELTIEYEAGGANLQGAILNSGGIAIAQAAMVSGMPGVIRAYTPNLPAGNYYVQAFGPASGALLTNNYKMTIKVTGP